MARRRPPTADKLGRASLASWLVVIAVIVLATAMRFVRTDAPSGFYRDEAAISAHVLCLAESGHTLDGARWPLVTPVLGGGHSSIVWQAPAVAWSEVTGVSIPAMRSLAAVCGTLTIVGVFFLALWATDSRRIGAFAALAAAVSPWAFQFSRVAWDAVIAPVYVTWACAFLFLATSPRAPRSKWLRWAVIVLSASLFAAACISYPPQRVQIPLVMLAFVAWKRAYVRDHFLELALFVGIFVACTAQLWLLTASGAIQGRYESLSVFSADYWAQRGVTSHGMVLLHGASLFAKNVLAHFSPSYLLLSGDANPRHSTQSFGEWSSLDALALLSAAFILLRRRRRLSGWVAFAAVGYAAGVCPAALTWEGIPHALRSIGAIPFLAVLVGTAIKTIGDELPRFERLLPLFAGGLGGACAIALGTVFFTTYATGASDAFDGQVVQHLVDPAFVDQAVNAERTGHLQNDSSTYPLMAIRYYELRTGAVRCGANGPII